MCVYVYVYVCVCVVYVYGVVLECVLKMKYSLISVVSVLVLLLVCLCGCVKSFIVNEYNDALFVGEVENSLQKVKEILDSKNPIYAADAGATTMMLHQLYIYHN